LSWSRASKRCAFLDVGARKQVGPGILERTGDLAGAVPVRIRLDHRQHLRRIGRPLARKMFGDVSEIPRDGAQVHARHSSTNHAL